MKPKTKLRYFLVLFLETGIISRGLQPRVKIVGRFHSAIPLRVHVNRHGNVKSSGGRTKRYHHQFITHKGSHKTKRLWKKTYKNVKLDCRAGPRQNHFTTKQLIIMHQAGTNHSQMINVNNLILTKTLKVTVLVSLFSLLTPKSVDLTQSLNSRGPECASGSAPWDWPHTVKPRIVAGSRIQAGPRIQAGGSSELYQ